MNADLDVLKLLTQAIQAEARKRFDGDDYEWASDWNAHVREGLYRDVISDMLKKAAPC